MKIEIANPTNNYLYNKKLRSYANKLRKNMTKAEALVWSHVLRARRMKGYQFRRQRPIGNYIVDFVCLKLLLVIEIDGETHDSEEAIEKDRIRDKFLSKAGFTVLRFDNEDVFRTIEVVEIEIGNWIEKNQ